MKQVVRFETADGKVWDTEEDALDHERKMQLRHIVTRFYYRSIDDEDIVFGLIDNIDDILRALLEIKWQQDPLFTIGSRQ